jgi:chemotaxis protein histidine kinase CheA
MDLEHYKQLFVEEVEQYLSELDRLLSEGDDLCADRQRWRETHTRIHSIKGMAVALSLDDMSDLSRAMEQWCYAFKEGTQPVTPQAIGVLREGLTLLHRMLDEDTGHLSPKTAAHYAAVCDRLALGPAALKDDSPP